MKCSIEVYRGNTRIKGIGAFSQCQREAVIVIEGKAYCWQHHPDKMMERELTSRERSESKWRSKQRVRTAYLKVITPNQ